MGKRTEFKHGEQGPETVPSPEEQIAFIVRAMENHIALFDNVDRARGAEAGDPERRARRGRLVAALVVNRDVWARLQNPDLAPLIPDHLTPHIAFVREDTRLLPGRNGGDITPVYADIDPEQIAGLDDAAADHIVELFVSEAVERYTAGIAPVDSPDGAETSVSTVTA